MAVRLNAHQGFRAPAERPSVYCRISGLITGAGQTGGARMTSWEIPPLVSTASLVYAGEPDGN